MSYSATSQLLSDKQLYPYFLRTVPSDENQARVMADLADIMHWNYVAILFSANSYGGPGRKALYDNLKAKNACIAQEYSLGSESAAAVPVKDIVANLKADPKIQVNIAFILLNTLTKFITLSLDHYPNRTSILITKEKCKSKLHPKTLF